MIEAPTPANERQRLKALRDLKLLDTPPEERFDRVTRLARRVFGAPIALVSLVDEGRQWFKSRQGLAAIETPRNISFCGHAILSDRIMVVPDATQDERFRDNPLVTCDPNVRFYAGYPLNAPDGSKIGTLCVIDRAPREVEQEDLKLLRELGRMIEEELVSIDLATTDPVVEISNRRGFNELADHALGLCSRLQCAATLLLFELATETIMERFGPAETQRALVEFAQLLMAAFRESDVIGRTGPNEFAVLLVGAEEKDVQRALHRLNECLAQVDRTAEPGRAPELNHHIVAFRSDRHVNAESMIREAEQSMAVVAPAARTA